VREDLLQFLSRQNDVTNVLITTFNIDLLFVENLVLRALRRCGDPSLTIFADAKEVRRTFDAQRRWVGRIGRRYRIVPVEMETGFRFHPKAVLVSAPEQASLFVGSGNVTFGGLRQNAEVWVRYDTSDGTAGPFAATQRFLNACIARAGDPAGARRDLQEAYDAETHRWVAGLAEPTDLLWRIASGRSLLDQVADVVSDSDITQITVACPFFDFEAVALNQIASRWPDAKLRVFVQSGRSTLDRRAAVRLGTRLTLQSVSSKNPNEQPAFFHAKFYAFESADRVQVFLGSANCSVAALTTAGTRGNGELLASIGMSQREFEELICGELVRHDEPPVLIEASPHEPEAPSDPSAVITSASFDTGRLHVRFRIDTDMQVDRLICDGHECNTESIDADAGRLEARLSAIVSRVQIAGEGPADRFESPEHWVDQEFMLGASSRQRRVARAIETNVSSGTWGLAAWCEVLRLLGDHLQYTPKHSALLSKRGTRSTTSERPTLRVEDFFASGYRLPRDHIDPAGSSDLGRLDGLRGLLLEYFGVDLAEEAGTDVDVDETDSDGDSEIVDRQERIRLKDESSRRKVSRREPTQTERRRAKRLAADVIRRLTSPDFLENRPASMLGTDLTIAATLMVAGFAEGWLEDDEYLQNTYKCWTALFFDGGRATESDREQRGWIDWLHDRAADPAGFAASVAKPGLAAALIIWRQSCPRKIPPAMRIRFELASRLAVARVPWLWRLHDATTLSREIGRIASVTGWWRCSGQSSLEQLLDTWEQVAHEGMALCAFEEILRGDAPGVWRNRTRERFVPANCMVWQGPLGFGVTGNTVPYSRDSKQMIPVSLFRAMKPETRIRADYVMPFRSLIDVVVRDVGDGGGGQSEIRERLQHFADALEQKHGPTA